MKTIKLQRMWWYIGFIILVPGLGLGWIGWSITMQVYDEWSRGVPISGGWNWPGVIALNMFFAWAYGALLWSLYCNCNVRISEDAVTKPALFGAKHFLWKEIDDVEYKPGLALIFMSGKRRFQLSLAIFTNQQGIAQASHEFFQRSR